MSGIDTNIGKSYATAYLAKTWNERGIRTITEKLIQTGNTDLSEDIELHRRIMGTGLLPEDKERLTMPEIFLIPALRTWLQRLTSVRLTSTRLNGLRRR